MDSHWLDLYRFAVSTVAVVTVAINLSVVMAARVSALPLARVVTWYALCAAATATVSLYFRLNDHRIDVPLNVGDFTALIPSVGFGLVGLGAMRVLGHKAGRDGLPEGMTDG